MLYGLVDLSEKKSDGLHSSTSTECWWIKPSRKRKLSPKKSQDLSFKKHKFNDSSKKIVKDKSSSSRINNPINVQKFSEKLAKVNKHAAWLYTNKSSIPKLNEEKVTVPDIPVLHEKINFMYLDTVNLASSSCQTVFNDYFVSLKVNDHECDVIEQESRGQSSNSDWHKARIGRLTSSSFGTICKRKVDTSPDCLVKSLLCYDKTEFDGPSVRWGRSHERAALRTYENSNKKKHEQLKVQTSGLRINSKFPHLGSSPDGLVSCKCCGKGLVEVKCPFTSRFKVPSEACEDSKFPCVMKDGKLKLKRNHNYYYQVQGQMALCNRNFCDFFVWTLKGFAHERIVFDQEFWNECVLKLNSFYVKAIVPELFSERVKLKLY